MVGLAMKLEAMFGGFRIDRHTANGIAHDRLGVSVTIAGVIVSTAAGRCLGCMLVLCVIHPPLLKYIPRGGI